MYSWIQLHGGREIRTELSVHNLIWNRAAVRNIARQSFSASLKFGDSLEVTKTPLTSGRNSNQLVLRKSIRSRDHGDAAMGISVKNCHNPPFVVLL